MLFFICSDFGMTGADVRVGNYRYLLNQQTLIIIFATIVIIFGGRYYFAHNKSYKNGAIEKGDCIYLNGVRYYQTSELENYKISNVVICTSDSRRKLYEIEEYPDYEYIAGYYAWDGVIYKKDETD